MSTSNKFKAGVTVFLARFKKHFPESAFVWSCSEAFGTTTHYCHGLDNELIFKIVDDTRRGHDLTVQSIQTRLVCRVGHIGRRLPKFKRDACFISAEILRRWKVQQKHH